MTNIEVLNLTTICRNFPTTIIHEITREHLLDTIDRIFSSGVNIVFVEGMEGIGKTTLLAQYAKRYPDEALSMFIKPTTRYFYDPELIRPIFCEQIHWALYNETLDKDLIDKSFLNTKIPLLQKRALRSHKNFYFIVDGLHHIPKEESGILELILKEILPIGLSGFRFLLSGDANIISRQLHHSALSKPFTLPTFSLNETEEYLQDLSLKKELVGELYKTCQGIPGNLASIRRIIESGTDIQTIFDLNPEKVPDFISIEWQKYIKLDSKYERLLAFVAYGKTLYSIEDLHRLSGIDFNKIEEFINNCEFLSIDDKSQQIDFISIPHKQFVNHQLSKFKEEVTNRLIDDLLDNKDSDVTLMNLPSYYEQAGRQSDLINYLTPETISTLLERSRSMSTLHDMASLGMNTAGLMNNNDALIRFSMHKSVINELTGADIWASEIEARMALNDEGSALALAQNTTSKEDRFYLLALIAKIQCKRGDLLDQTITEQINVLYEQIDPKSLGARATEIASVLIWSDPDLAIKLVESARNITDDTIDMSLAYSQLSVEAQQLRREHLRSTDAVEKALQRISDPKLKEFSTALAVFFEDCTSEEVIELVDKIDIEYRVFLLRYWAIANESRIDATDVINYALDLLIKDTVYTPKTRDFREIATPLPSISDKSQAQLLVGRFDSLKSSAEKTGTTEDYIALQLILAETESKYSFEAAYNRVLEIYWYISSIDDLSIITDCLALMVTRLNKIDPNDIIESKEGLKTVLQDELKSNIKRLLDMTGDHYLTARGTIKALMKTRPDEAIQLAKDLNTEYRRDMAFNDIIDTLIEIPVNIDHLSYINVALDNIVDSSYRDRVIDKVIRRLEDRPSKLDSSAILELSPLLDKIKNISSDYLKCKVACYAYALLSDFSNDEFADVSSGFLELMRSAWESIDVAWAKIDAGFRIASKLAESIPELAKGYLLKAEESRNSINLNAEEYALTYLGCLHLAIRAFSGLIPKHLYSEEDLKQLKELINRIPSNGERAGLFGELAIRSYYNNNLELCKEIVANNIKPLLDNLNKDDLEYRFTVFNSIIPALYRANPVTTFEMISKLPQYQQDVACATICNSILRKKVLSDPYDATIKDGYILNYDDATEICAILNLCSTDINIYTYIAILSNSILLRKNRYSFTSEQKLDIANRLERIIESKLPDKNNIKHNGYIIIAKAQVERFRKSKTEVWDKLIQDARSIPNTADKALVLYTIAALLPSKSSSKRDQIIRESINMVDNIPVFLEKVDKYEHIAEEMTIFDMIGAKHLLESAMELSIQSNESDEVVYPKQRRIIDLAYKIEPSFADQLATIMDRDPARIKARLDLEDHLETLKLKGRMLEPGNDVSITEANKAHYPKAAWMNLGALNSGKVSTVHLDRLIPYIRNASGLPIREAYPIFSWVIENLVIRMANTDQARTYVTPIFGMTLLNAELSWRLTNRYTNQINQIKDDVKKISTISDNIVINDGERKKAIEFIKNWLQHEVKGYLKICDPYFGPEDLEILKILREVNPNCEVYILCSRRNQEKTSTTLDEAYQAYWNLHFSGSNPPKTEVVIIGTKSTGDFPIHDRWWLTNRGGLRLGTSFNSLGLSKTSEISIFSIENATKCELEVDQYLRRERQEFKKEKLDYLIFSL